MEKSSKEVVNKLCDEAKKVAENAYAVYSNFRVGAALITTEGKIFTGANVENKSFGLTNCAERTAIFQCVSQGYRNIKTIVVYTPTETPTAPCGACRQVISEFAEDAEIICICDTDLKMEGSSKYFLPDSEFPVDLKK